jgi:hypothetical protein
MVLLSKLRKSITKSATPHLNFRRHLVGVQKYYSKQEMESAARYLFAVNHSYKNSRFVSPDVQDNLAMRARKGSNKN